MEVGYYPGCTLHASSALYDVQSRLVFQSLGVQLKEIPDWNCCGATSAAKNDDFLAIALPARNLGLALASGFTQLLIPCSSCLNRMLVAQKRLDCDLDLKREINAELSQKVLGTVRILSILEALKPFVDSHELSRKTTKKLKGLKPACYYGCLLTRFPCDVPVPDDVENPQGMESVLRELDAEPREWNYKTDCCGASASVNNREVALKLMAKIIKDATARGANCFVTTCPMCQLNLDAYQEAAAKRIDLPERLPVYFLTELIGVALGMDLQSLQLDRHFVEATGLLRRLNLA